jgi:hypothetical protein
LTQYVLSRQDLNRVPRPACFTPLPPKTVKHPLEWGRSPGLRRALSPALSPPPAAQASACGHSMT